jgi:thiamine-monophosphate kinase
MTVLGAPIGPRTPARADACAGDDVWLSGAVGDAWLGLGALQGEINLDPAHRNAAIARYRLPQPRMDIAPLIAAHAHAAMDVSDGLAGDAAKLAHASGVRVEIEAEAVPLSPAARAWRQSSHEWGRLLDFGDDYEVLFTAPAAARAALVGAPVQRIGRVSTGAGAAILDDAGKELPLRAGHAHRLGR